MKKFIYSFLFCSYIVVSNATISLDKDGLLPIGSNPPSPPENISASTIVIFDAHHLTWSSTNTYHLVWRAEYEDLLGIWGGFQLLAITTNRFYTDRDNFVFEKPSVAIQSFTPTNSNFWVKFVVPSGNTFDLTRTADFTNYVCLETFTGNYTVYERLIESSTNKNAFYFFEPRLKVKKYRYSIQSLKIEGENPYLGKSAEIPVDRSPPWSLNDTLPKKYSLSEGKPVTKINIISNRIQ